MDSVYKYGYCHRYRPDKGNQNTKADGSPEPMDVQQWSDGFTTRWIPSDIRQNFDNRKELAEQLGWTDNNVKYRFNQWGFRHQGDFVENKNALVALGCSITFGVGVNYEQTWPYYVARELGLDCINLAQPGTGIQASYRAAKMWLPVIKPKAVMFYVPDPHRIELWPYPDDREEDHYADSIKSIGPWHGTKDTDKKWRDHFEMCMSSREVAIRREAYMDAMRHICKESKFIDIPSTEQTAGRSSKTDDLNDMIVIDRIHNIAEETRGKLNHNMREQNPNAEFTSCLNTDEARWARDMVHPGPRVMRDNIAPMFIRKYRES